MTRSARAASLAMLLALVPAVQHPLAAADGITPVTVQILDAWVRAVHAHVPGTPDESVAVVRRLTYQNRVMMNAGIDFFFFVLRGVPVSTKGDHAKEEIVLLARGAGMPDVATFLKRAAVLHTDAAIFAERFPQPEDTSMPPPRTAPPPARNGGEFPSTFRAPVPRVPALLTNTSLVRHKDGDVLGTTRADWNWPFARDLLDELIRLQRLASDMSLHAHDPFIAEWYHAVAAYLFANRRYGDATDHFFHATEVLPNDPRLLFDRGCYAEILGLPANQVFLSDWPAPVRPNVPELERTNREAERLFRGALDVDPSFVEARVHLARLLDVGGWHAEAATQLNKALESNPGGIVGFYGHLFAGRVAQERGALEDAAAQYRAALAIFPSAQSALLGLSQVSLAAGDARAALRTLEGLGPASAQGDADPWWDYALASGRDVNELIQHLWALSR